jgi:hypothetical protein
LLREGWKREICDSDFRKHILPSFLDHDIDVFLPSLTQTVRASGAEVLYNVGRNRIRKIEKILLNLLIEGHPDLTIYPDLSEYMVSEIRQRGDVCKKEPTDPTNKRMRGDRQLFMPSLLPDIFVQ